MNIRTITALTIPVIFLACSGTESSTALQPVGDSSVSGRQALVAQLESANVTLDQATEAAIAAHAGSHVREADLDGSGTEVRYEIELSLADGSVVEVHVDAITGEIIASFLEDDGSDDDDGDEDATIDCTGAISALEAQQIAEAETAGTAVEIDIDDGCEFEITVETATGFAEVEVAPDGSVLQIESDDAEDATDSDGDDMADSGDDMAGSDAEESDDEAGSESDEPESDVNDAADGARDVDG